LQSLNTFAAVYEYIVPKNHAWRHLFRATYQLDNLLVDCARELFKPLENSASLRVCFGFQFFC